MPNPAKPVTILGAIEAAEGLDSIEIRSTLTFLNPSDKTAFVTDLGAGTVTSVQVSVPSFLAVAGGPITSSGTLAITLANQTANFIMCGPATGSAAAPTFRLLVAADIPSHSTDKLNAGTLPASRGGTGYTSISALRTGLQAPAMVTVADDTERLALNTGIVRTGWIVNQNGALPEIIDITFADDTSGSMWGKSFYIYKVGGYEIEVYLSGKTDYLGNSADEATMLALSPGGPGQWTYRDDLSAVMIWNDSSWVPHTEPIGTSDALITLTIPMNIDTAAMRVLFYDAMISYEYFTPSYPSGGVVRIESTEPGLMSNTANAGTSGLSVNVVQAGTDASSSYFLVINESALGTEGAFFPLT